MATRIVKVEPFDLVVFGGTGDLAYRKLYPALFHRERSNQFSEPTRIIGASRRHLDRDAFRASVKDALTKFDGIDDEAGAATERFLSRLDYVAVDATSDGGMGGSEGVARRRRTHPRLLSRDRPRPVRPARQAPRRRRAGDPALAHHRREADRQGRRERRGDQRCDRLGLPRATTFSASTTISARNRCRT